MTTAARVWLVIAHGGGRWSMPEVRAQLPQEKRGTVDSVLQRLGSGGFLKLYEPKPGKTYGRLFGVTADCLIPQGLTAWEVLEALAVPMRQDVEDGPVPKGSTAAEVIRTMGVQRKAA